MQNTATPQTDPDGQALMTVLTDLGAPPGDAYNATQGVRNMASQNVTARLEAKIETFGAEIRVEIGGLSAKVDRLEGTVAGLEGQVESHGFQLQSLTSQMESQGTQLQTLTSTVQDLSSQMASLVSKTDVLSAQMQSLVTQVEPLASPTSGLAAQVAALTAQVQGQAAQADASSSMMTLLVVLLTALVGTGILRWFSDWRHARKVDGAGGSDNQSES